MFDFYFCGPELQNHFYSEVNVTHASNDIELLKDSYDEKKTLVLGSVGAQWGDDINLMSERMVEMESELIPECPEFFREVSLTDWYKHEQKQTDDSSWWEEGSTMSNLPGMEGSEEEDECRRSEENNSFPDTSSSKTMNILAWDESSHPLLQISALPGMEGTEEEDECRQSEENNRFQDTSSSKTMDILAWDESSHPLLQMSDLPGMEGSEEEDECRQSEENNRFQDTSSSKTMDILAWDENSHPLLQISALPGMEGSEEDTSSSKTMDILAWDENSHPLLQMSDLPGMEGSEQEDECRQSEENNTFQDTSSSKTMNILAWDNPSHPLLQQKVREKYLREDEAEEQRAAGAVAAKIVVRHAVARSLKKDVPVMDDKMVKETSNLLISRQVVVESVSFQAPRSSASFRVHANKNEQSCFSFCFAFLSSMLSHK